MNRLCLVPELEPKQEAATTNIYHLLDFLQPLPQMRFNRAHVNKHLVILDCVQRSANCNHRDHAAAECCSQIIFLDVRSDLLGHQTSAHRNSTAERLGKRNDVGNDSLSGLAAGKKPFACAADAGLDFVINQNDAALVAKLAQLSIKRRRRHPHTGHRLNRFQHDRSD